MEGAEGLFGRASAGPQREVLVIGCAVPEELAMAIVAADRFSSIQTYKFQDRLIRALACSGNRVRVVSTPPVSDWSTRRFIGYRRWRHPGSAGWDYIFPVINLIGIKQLSVLAGCMLGTFQWAIRTMRRRRESIIVVADIFMPHLLAGVIGGKIAGRKVVAVITDMPGLAPLPDGWFKRLLRPLDRGGIRRLLQEVDGLIVLSEHTHRDLFPQLPHIVMEGFIDVRCEAEGESPPSSRKGSGCVRFVVMYAGGLGRGYGLSILLDTIRFLQGDQFEFWIAGKGEGEDEVRAAARDDPRIRYLGFLDPAKVAELQQQASVLINPRPPEAGYARYSFPSKLLEYMASGTPVVTTRFPSLPPEYEEYLIVPPQQDAVGLAEALRGLAHWPQGKRQDLGRRARGFVCARASIAGQGARIEAFLASLRSPDTAGVDCSA